jgi:hypothetical protein
LESEADSKDVVSEISVPLDGKADTHQEISVALQLASRHRCPVVGWKVSIGCTTPYEFARDVDAEYGTHFASTRYRHSRTSGEVLYKRFLEEAAIRRVSARIAEEEILEIPNFYHQSATSDVAVLSSETVKFWREVESNGFLQGDFACYRMAPLLILGTYAGCSFEEVIFAYDGSTCARAALKAYADLNLGSTRSSTKVLVCDGSLRRARTRAAEAERLVRNAGIDVADVLVRNDFVSAVIDQEFFGRSVLVVAGLSSHPHPHRPRFGHLADHLIETRSVSMLLAC